MKRNNKWTLYVLLAIIFLALTIYAPYLLIILLIIIIVLIFIRSRKYNADALNDKTEYIDANGYNRDTIKHSNLTHRNIAYYSIYLKHKDKYPLPFRMYQVHHKDHNKLNNNVENLEIFTKEEHQAIHKKR
jgi:hypothetical protein